MTRYKTKIDNLLEPVALGEERAKTVQNELIIVIIKLCAIM